MVTWRCIEFPLTFCVNDRCSCACVILHNTLCETERSKRTGYYPCHNNAISSTTLVFLLLTKTRKRQTNCIEMTRRREKGIIIICVPFPNDVQILQYWRLTVQVFDLQFCWLGCNSARSLRIYPLQLYNCKNAVVVRMHANLYVRGIRNLLEPSPVVSQSHFTHITRTIFKLLVRYSYRHNR